MAASSGTGAIGSAGAGAPEEILGVHELAQLAGVSQRTLSAYLVRGQCPEPDWRLACGPVWRRESVRSWLLLRQVRRRHRKRHREAVAAALVRGR